MKYKLINKRNLSWSLLVFWALFILYLSSQNAMQSNELSLTIAENIISQLVENFNAIPVSTASDINGFVRILGHFSEYLILGFLMTNVLKQTFNTSSYIFLTLPFGLMFSFLDESLQYFVPGRAFEYADIGVDFMGILAGFLLFLLALLIFKLIKRLIFNKFMLLF